MCAASPQPVMCTLLGAPGVASRGGKQSSWTTNLSVVYSLHCPGEGCVHQECKQALAQPCLLQSGPLSSEVVTALLHNLQHFWPVVYASTLHVRGTRLPTSGHLPVDTYQWVTYLWIHWFLLSRTCQDCSLCALAVARW